MTILKLSYSEIMNMPIYEYQRLLELKTKEYERQIKTMNNIKGKME